jgi:hypothetical protein
MRKLWINGDPETRDIIELLDVLRGLGPVERWRPGGFVTSDHPDEYVPCYWGDDKGNLVSDLLPDERVLVEDALCH